MVSLLALQTYYQLINEQNKHFQYFDYCYIYLKNLETNNIYKLIIHNVNVFEEFDNNILFI